MSDELGRSPVTVDGLYKHRQYVSPVKYDWHAWYAWYPVRIIEWRDVGYKNTWIKMSRWVWLQKVMRRHVEDEGYMIASRPIGPSNYTEYTSIEEYLRHG